MARKTKESEEIKKQEGAVSKLASSATSSIKKVVSSLTSKKSSSKTTTKTKKDEKITKNKSTVAKKDITKSEKDAVAQSAKSKTTTSKSNNTISDTSKKATTSSKSNKNTSSQSTTNTTMKKYKTAFPEKFEAEYYDFPNGYNATVVKILAQTPKTLFIYWEISEDDRKSYIEKYGKNFFEVTRPILTVYNDTLNYSFEVEVNDFANSWYLNINDSKCDYHVEFGRRPIPQNQIHFQQPVVENTASQDENSIKPKEPIPDYIYLTSSNEMSVPNNRILFNFKNPIKFKNIKTGFETQKDFAFISNLGVLNINSLYKKLFPNDYYNLVNEPNHSINNPSSGIFSSQFK